MTGKVRLTYEDTGRIENQFLAARAEAAEAEVLSLRKQLVLARASAAMSEVEEIRSWRKAGRVDALIEAAVACSRIQDSHTGKLFQGGIVTGARECYNALIELIELIN